MSHRHGSPGNAFGRRLFGDRVRLLLALVVLAAFIVVLGVAGLGGLVRAAETGDDRLALDLVLTVTGELPVHELALEADAGLADLARALAALSATPLPPGSALPVSPVADTAAWSQARALDVDVFTELEAAPGHTLRVLTVELENLDERTHRLPHAVADDPMAAFDEADALLLQATGVDARGRRHPAAAVLCGEQARLVPGGRLPCRLVWQVPDGLELQAVELVVPARLQLPVREEE